MGMPFFQITFCVLNMPEPYLDNSFGVHRLEDCFTMCELNLLMARAKLSLLDRKVNVGVHKIWMGNYIFFTADVDVGVQTNPHTKMWAETNYQYERARKKMCFFTAKGGRQ